MRREGGNSGGKGGGSPEGKWVCLSGVIFHCRLIHSLSQLSLSFSLNINLFPFLSSIFIFLSFFLCSLYLAPICLWTISTLFFYFFILLSPLSSLSLFAPYSTFFLSRLLALSLSLHNGRKTRGGYHIPSSIFSQFIYLFIYLFLYSFIIVGISFIPSSHFLSLSFCLSLKGRETGERWQIFLPVCSMFIHSQFFLSFILAISPSIFPLSLSLTHTLHIEGERRERDAT